MKKLLFIVAATVMVASCKRKFTCECRITANGTTNITSDKTAKLKKKDAKSACGQHNGSAVVNQYGTTYVQTTDCGLK